MKKPLIALLKFFGIYEPLFRRRRLGQLQTKAAPLGMSVYQDGNVIVISRGNDELIVSLRHLAYIDDILNSFDVYFKAVEPKIKNGKSTVDYSQPGIHTMKELNLDFKFTSFAESYQSLGLYLELSQLKPGSVVFDLGGYCGVSSYVFAKAVGPNGKVFTFEADKENFQALEVNKANLSMDNVTLINKGAWSSSTTLMFQREGNLGSGFTQVLGRKSNLVEVETITLGEMIKQFKVERIDLIKVDIEGSEIEVIESSGDILRKYKPKLVIEPHFVGGEISTKRICAALEKFGYKFKVIPQGDIHLPLIFGEAA